MWSIEVFNLLSLIVYVVAVTAFPLAMVFAAKVLGPSNPNRVKNSTFECGQVPIGEAHVQFNVQYLPYAMIYAIYGALAVFLLLISPGIVSFNAEMLRTVTTTIVIASVGSFAAAISLRPRAR